MKRTVCGLDVHKDSAFCCVLCKNGRKIQHKFGVLTDELITLCDLMESEGVEECAMESTGIYWMPTWRVLEDSVKQHLVNPYFIKQLPGKKSDFVPERRLNINRSLELSKHIMPYMSFDSEGEKEFAESLQEANEVLIFAKLPRKLKIPTPVGNYAPDWAIVFDDNCGIRHVFFVAETKGSLDKMELRGVEKAKTECAKQLFNSLSTNKTRYGVVDNFAHLYDTVNGID